MTRYLHRYALAGIAFLLPLAALSADPIRPMRAAQAARLQGEITLDGKLDERAWSLAPEQTGFAPPLGVNNRQEIPADMQTSFRVLYDDNKLYFGITCKEPHPESIVADAAHLHDAAMWTDDDVEIFLDPVGDRQEYYQFAINSQGTVVDLYQTDGGNSGKDPWSTEWDVATAKGKDFWSVEIAIPFGALHNRPSSMWADRWVASFCRSRAVKPSPYFLSQFSPSMRYHDIKNFGFLDGIKIDKSRFNLYADAPQVTLEPREGGYRASGSLRVENRDAKPFTGTLEMAILTDGATGDRVPITLAANERKTIVIPGGFVRAQGTFPIICRLTRPDGSLALVTRSDTRFDYTPITIQVTQPNYRNTIYATQTITSLAGVVKLALPEAQLRDAKAHITLTGPNNFTRGADYTVAGANIPFSIPVSDLPIGQSQLNAEITGPSGKLAQSSVAIYKMPAAPIVEARIDDQGNVLIDGLPVLIRGWYSDLEYVMGDAAFPQAQLPSSTNFFLHGATNFEEANMGVYTMRNLTRLIDEAKGRYDQPIDDGLKARLRAAIAAVRDNRHVIGYYIEDGPHCRGVSPVYMRYVYEFMKQEDPYRICVIGCGVPAFSASCDINSPRPFMSPQRTDDGVRTMPGLLRLLYNEVSTINATNDGSKAVWCVPQAFSTGGVAGDFPTFKESRWFAYSAFAGGAKGIAPFLFGSAWNHPEMRASWNYIYEDLTFIAPAWCARDTNTALTSSDPDVVAIAKRYKPEGAANAQTFIIASNLSAGKRVTTFSIPALQTDGKSRLLVVRENRIITVKNGRFVDIFDGMGTHLYTTLEVLPDLKSLDDINKELAEMALRPLKEGNLLAQPKILWRLANNERAPMLADGCTDNLAWPYDQEETCEIRFAKPITFSRIVLHSPTISGAEVDIWTKGAWVTIHRWQDQLLYRLEYTGKPVTTDRLRIRPTAVRQGYGAAKPQISELGLYR